ncbi:trafficking protein particle complex subunit 9-like [Vicugna pacos]|uniref:Trafficking protein particle complex subunit 9-like n=1 Tax=Vicugna pacos TaxID=30538 RepID=A0ABM5CHJ3_VICPA
MYAHSDCNFSTLACNMSIPDYVQCAEDHQTLPVVVQTMEIISEENFFCIYQLLTSVSHISPCGSQWTLCIPLQAPLCARESVERLPETLQGRGPCHHYRLSLCQGLGEAPRAEELYGTSIMTLSSLSLYCMWRKSSSRAPTLPSNLEDCRVVEKRIEEFTESLFILLNSKWLDGGPKNSGDKIPLPCIPFEKEDFMGLDTDSRYVLVTETLEFPYEL